MPTKVYIPKAGKTWNRLRDYPRNEACFCGSGEKFKKCHLQRLMPCVTEEAAKKIQRFLDLRAKGKAVRLVLTETRDPTVGEAELEEGRQGDEPTAVVKASWWRRAKAYMTKLLKKLRLKR